MDIKSNAKRHFAARLSSELGQVEVPEWGDDEDSPAVIYYRPMTMGQQIKIFKAMNEGTLIRGFATALAVRARDADGKLIWRGSEVEVEAIIKEYDPAVVQRVVTAMGGLDNLLPEEDVSGN